MRAAALALLTLLPLLAGCSQPTPPPDEALRHARVAEVGGRLNQQVTSDPVARQANELSIAVDPTNAKNLIATGKDYTPEHAGQCVWDGIYVSHDGGATWKDANLRGSPWKVQSDTAAGRTPSPDPQLSRFYCATDPIVRFGPDGTAYWAVMPYQCDPASGSKDGAGTLPPGGLNDWFWTCSSMYVLASFDAGDSWSTATEVAFGPRLMHDKAWLAVAPDNTVLLCWDQSAWASGAAREEYGAITQGSPAPPFPDSPAATPGAPVPDGSVCAVSKDHGKSWTQPAHPGGSMPLATDAAYVPYVDFDANGTAWMAGVDGRRVVALSSPDGLAWSAPAAVANYTDPPSKIMNGFSTLNGSVFRVAGFPALAVDRSGGPHSGNLYATWMDGTGGVGRTMLAVSRDYARSWTVAWIHDLAANDTDQRGDQFMPTLNVGPDGTVDLAWFDRRMDPQNHLFDLFYAYSADGGATFSQVLRVSEQSSDEQYSHHQNGAIFLGDYMDMASAPGEAHPIWVDTRNHKADAFTATIRRPSANP